MALTVSDDWLFGWLQRPARDTICQNLPVCGHHTGFAHRGFPSPMGAARVRPVFDIKPPLGAPLLIIQMLSCEVFSPKGYFRKTAGA